MTGPSVLVPNLAAEEGAVWDAEAGEGAAGALARLWRCLFPPESRMLGATTPFEQAWPAALGPAPPGVGALRTLEAPGRAFAWLNTAEALELAAAEGQPLAGAPPEVVARVHDKAFAQRAAEREGLVPPPLRGLVDVLDPDALRDPDAALARIANRAAALPDWTAGRFTLKPRWGSSGRGRVAGRRGDDPAPLRGALPRLAERGGALLEPWCERRADASVQLWVDPEAGVTLLGSLELLVTAAGVYRGHRGWIDYKARVASGLAEDETLREAAALVAAAARAEGYAGPCGVDGFRFAGPDGEALRPVVELNARFTAGTVAIGLLRRLWPRLRERHGLEPGERRAFLFALAPPEGGWPEAEGVERIDLDGTVGDADGPALLVARDAEAIAIRT